MRNFPKMSVLLRKRRAKCIFSSLSNRIIKRKETHVYVFSIDHKSWTGPGQEQMRFGRPESFVRNLLKNFAFECIWERKGLTELHSRVIFGIQTLEKACLQCRKVTSNYYIKRNIFIRISSQRITNLQECVDLGKNLSLSCRTESVFPRWSGGLRWRWCPLNIECQPTGRAASEYVS